MKLNPQRLSGSLNLSLHAFVQWVQGCDKHAKARDSGKGRPEQLKTLLIQPETKV
jgi:hypothetical protein